MKQSDAGSLFAGARVAEAVPLAPLTTLRIGPVARRLITCTSTEQVVAVLRELDSDARAARGGPTLVFAGGSNLVIADTLDDLTAVRLANDGETVRRFFAGLGESCAAVLEAGWNWGVMHVPGLETRRLREMVRQRVFLVQARTMIKNRVHALLDRYYHVPMPAVSDVFGKRGRDITPPLIRGVTRATAPRSPVRSIPEI